MPSGFIIFIEQFSYSILLMALLVLCIDLSLFIGMKTTRLILADEGKVNIVETISKKV